MSWRDWKSDPIYYARESLLVVFAVSALSLTCAAAPIYILYGCYRSYFPSDSVTVQILNIRDDVNFLCVVAETDVGPRAIKWYLGSIQGQGAMHPDQTSISDPRYSATTQFSHDAQWQAGKRYAVLTHEDGGAWRLYWFTTDEAKVQGGTWTALLPDIDKSERPSAEFLKEIGVSPREVP